MGQTGPLTGLEKHTNLTQQALVQEVLTALKASDFLHVVLQKASHVPRSPKGTSLQVSSVTSLSTELLAHCVPGSPDLSTWVFRRYLSPHALCREPRHLLQGAESLAFTL